jgi:two-component system response regulator AtoC
MKKRILIIDDDEEMRSLICRQLSFPAYVLDSAACGRQGRRLIESGDYDLVITDFHLPDTNASLLISDLRKKFPHLHFFVISGDLAGKEQKLGALGVSQCFSKPLNWNELKTSVKQILSHEYSLNRY